MLEISEFYISTKNTFLGASSGSAVSCECWVVECLEVKYPYSYKDMFITESLTDKSTCLSKTKVFFFVSDFSKFSCRVGNNFLCGKFQRHYYASETSVQEYQCLLLKRNVWS